MVFNEIPPHDIWPYSQQPVSEVDVSQLYFRPRMKASLLCLFVTPFIVTKLLFDVAFPFNLDGPEFLLFYALVCTAAVYSFNLVYKTRKAKLRAFIKNNFPGKVSVFQMAEFIDGKKGAVQTGILDLVRKKVMHVSENKKFTVNLSNAIPGDQNPLLVLLSPKDNGSEYDYQGVENHLYKKIYYSHQTLDKIKESVAKQNFRYVYLPLSIVLLGFIRVAEGLVFNQPVLGLILEIFFFCFLIIRTAVVHHFSKHHIVEEESISAYNKNTGSPTGEHDEVVKDFTLHNKPKFINPEEKILASIFFASVFQPNGSSQISSDSGGGDGGGGSGCGGGCGGCGGCGG